MKMRCAVIFALLCLASLALLAQGANLLEVSKTVEAGPKTGVYTVTIGYKVIGAPGRVNNVNIADSLPEELALVSGDLVVKAEDVRPPPLGIDWLHCDAVAPFISFANSRIL
jgi:hypothetical protein